ncbi:cadmium-translocating P-type ATPase domain protein, partial [Chlamydia psittaci 84-8471/1]
FP